MNAEPRTNAIFKFLKANASVNEAIQVGFVREALSPARVEERALLLMQHVLQTQSRPQLDKLLEFIKPAALSGMLRTCTDFRQYMSKLRGRTDLWEALRDSPGWGNKTAALMVRNLAIAHHTPDLRRRFWRDIDVIDRSEIRLPVDAVIQAVFQRMGPLDGRKPLATFIEINDHLQRRMGFGPEEMFLWDDLWFWGFITQKSTPGAKHREHVWNEAKYWSIPHAPKDARVIRMIQRKAQEFLELTRPNAPPEAGKR